MALLLLPRGLASVFSSQRLVYAGNLRRFSSISPSQHIQSTMEVELTAPNGRKWTQPLGLFINNEFVESSGGQKITSINPTYVP
jgi:hypothetical protein